MAQWEVSEEEQALKELEDSQFRMFQRKLAAGELDDVLDQAPATIEEPTPEPVKVRTADDLKYARETMRERIGKAAQVYGSKSVHVRKLKEAEAALTQEMLRAEVQERIAVVNAAAAIGAEQRNSEALRKEWAKAYAENEEMVQKLKKVDPAAAHRYAEQFEEEHDQGRFTAELARRTQATLRNWEARGNVANSDLPMKAKADYDAALRAPAPVSELNKVQERLVRKAFGDGSDAAAAAQVLDASAPGWRDHPLARDLAQVDAAGWHKA
jgi:flagellar biosynthesis GTPase FlhF